MHLRARVVEGRDAEEAVVLRLAVVVLLHAAGVHEAAVAQDDGLGEARRAGAEVDRRVVVVREGDGGRAGRTVAREAAIRLREGGAVVAHVEARAHARHAVDDLLDAARELRAEDEDVRVREFEAVLDLVRRVAEVERHGQTARPQRAEVDRQPLQAVHQQDGDLVALLVAAAQEEVREAVRLLLELGPGDLAAERLDRARFDQRVFPPRRVAVLQFLRIDLHQRDVVRPFPCIARQDFCDLHGLYSTTYFRMRHARRGDTAAVYSNCLLRN